MCNMTNRFWEEEVRPNTSNREVKFTGEFDPSKKTHTEEMRSALIQTAQKWKLDPSHEPDQSCFICGADKKFERVINDNAGITHVGTHYYGRWCCSQSCFIHLSDITEKLKAPPPPPSGLGGGLGSLREAGGDVPACIRSGEFAKHQATARNNDSTPPTALDNTEDYDYDPWADNNNPPRSAIPPQRRSPRLHYSHVSSHHSTPAIRPELAYDVALAALVKSDSSKRSKFRIPKD